MIPRGGSGSSRTAYRTRVCLCARAVVKRQAMVAIVVGAAVVRRWGRGAASQCGGKRRRWKAPPPAQPEPPFAAAACCLAGASFCRAGGSRSSRGEEPLTQVFCLVLFPWHGNTILTRNSSFPLSLFLFCFRRWICTICPRVYTHIFLFSFVRGWNDSSVLPGVGSRAGSPTGRLLRGAASRRSAAGAPEQTLRTERFGLGGEDKYRRMTSYPVQM